MCFVKEDGCKASSCSHSIKWHWERPNCESCRFFCKYGMQHAFTHRHDKVNHCNVTCIRSVFLPTTISKCQRRFGGYEARIPSAVSPTCKLKCPYVIMNSVLMCFSRVAISRGFPGVCHCDCRPPRAVHGSWCCNIGRRCVRSMLRGRLHRQSARLWFAGALWSLVFGNYRANATASNAATSKCW